MNDILFFSDISITDVPLVGGKNASLGEMYSRLAEKGISVPAGFAISADAFRRFLTGAKLDGLLDDLMEKLDKNHFANLAETGKKARALIMGVTLPEDLKNNIVNAYRKLCDNTSEAVAVRSSATAEDLPQASFAGQHESYLNVTGTDALLTAVQKCFASMYTDRAIKYRIDNGFEHSKVALSVGVQKMVAADKGCSGVIFTLEPESGFRDIIHLSGVWGLGENIVQGTASPDEFLVFKPTLRSGKKAIIQKNIGEKAKMMIHAAEGDALLNIDTPASLRNKPVLSETEIMQLAKWALVIEDHYGLPMDIEWAKDGNSGEIFIIQARPETVHSSSRAASVTTYRLLTKGESIATGQAVGSKIAAGPARLLTSPKDGGKVQPGDIIVAELTSPDWDPLLTKAAALITDKGGRTSHASIVAREIGIPAIVGSGNATQVIRDGDWITVSCAEGKNGNVYRGKLEWEAQVIDIHNMEMPSRTKAMLIAGDPGKAFSLCQYPSNGVGLLRIEFIINHTIGIHPMALVKFNTLGDNVAAQQIEYLTSGYADKCDFFIDKLAQGVATIAAAFYPREVIVRMSDFKTNEYANLLGGKEFEPSEENPMIGFRGASRYYHPSYKEGFRLECEAMRIVRNEMGLTNVKLMIPFCRTVEEGARVIKVMEEFGLSRGENGLKIFVMAEIPSNVIQAEEFGAIFDGFSIGSNDLTQLTLGIDRDSELVADLFNERNRSAMEMIATVISKAKKIGKPIGLCGQAPSDYPDFAGFLVSLDIDSISFNPDALMKGIENIKRAESDKETLILQTEN